MKFLLCIVPAFALCACAGIPTITGTPTGTLPVPITNHTIVTDLQDAAFNLDQAVAVGALAANDPAPTCLHDLLQKAGIEVPAGGAAAKSFTPRNSGVASAGAIAYIFAQQAKSLGTSGVSVDPSCEALVGRITIDGVKAANKATVGLIPGLAIH